MQKKTNDGKPVSDQEALAMYQIVDRMMRRFKLEPGLLAGSLYSDLHINDVGLITVLSEAGEWNVRKIARELDAPDSTISSALDRLEKRKLIARVRRPGDRRVVHLVLTSKGQRLANKLRDAHLENCRSMLTTLSPSQRQQLIDLASMIVPD